MFCSEFQYFDLCFNGWVFDLAESGNSEKGIISQAIADAAAASQRITAQGYANVSLLEQQSQKRSPSVNSHFTFTYESESSSKPVWPKDGSSAGAAGQTTQSGPSVQGNAQGYAGLAPPPGIPVPTQPTQNVPDNHLVEEPPRKPRRPASKRYAVAAKERRSQQTYNNYHHPPKEEDFWVCQFCDYESIFGKPPVALIRYYEAKDEKERQRQAEKRRLLEKAKMKGRKGKKGKGQGKAATTAPNPVSASQPAYDPLMPGEYPAYDHPEDTYYEDDFDEPGPTPAPSPENLPQRTHSIGPVFGPSIKTAAAVQGSKGTRKV